MINYMNELKKLNNKAIVNNDVPVSCIIVYKNKIISKAYNKREYKNNPLLHAEIIAIQKAAKKLNTWNLSECKLFVTLKPCNMCMEVIKESRINEIYYVLNNDKNVNRKVKLIEINCKDKQYFVNQLKDFFSDKR